MTPSDLRAIRARRRASERSALAEVGLAGHVASAREAAHRIAEVARATGASATVCRSGDPSRRDAWLVAVRRGEDSDSPRTEWWVRVVGGRVLLDCPTLAARVAA